MTFRPPTLAWFLLTAATVFAGAPDTIVGWIYYETGVYSGPQPRQRYEQFAATFAADGSYAQLYFLSNPGAGSPSRLGQPHDGVFTYRKVDAVTAEFSLSGVQVGVLKFDSPDSDSGEFVDPARDHTDLNGIVARYFRLARANPGAGLANCSMRTFILPGGKAHAGFVVGSRNRTVLIRGIGPSLAAFGITDPLRNPSISVSRTPDAVNDGWTAENAESIRRTSAAVGAFPLSGPTDDAALIVNLVSPGAYIVEASSADPTDSGEVLIEVYLLP